MKKIVDAEYSDYREYGLDSRSGDIRSRSGRVYTDEEWRKKKDRVMKGIKKRRRRMQREFVITEIKKKIMGK